ncbi:MAG: nodulation protein NfeD [Deltaproteobacteria bacterium]|nr:nodulation protein NfeD [Deltaproteobacteria bacterium]
MSKVFRLVIFTLFVLSPLTTTASKILVVEINSSINPATVDYLNDAIREATLKKYEAIVILLDTPGGLVSSTREIVKSIMSSDVPVIVYVYPDGARAGSAGVFITMAAHIAAMAPGTNIGAAHPVEAGGQDVDKRGGRDLKRKIENDTIAFIESIAEKRNRNKDWAIRAVRDSVSVTASKALEEKVIDVVAKDINELLMRINGMEVETASGKKILNTGNASRTVFQMNIRQKITNLFADPNISYILMMIGIVGIMMELYHPGVIFPGVIGGISLILAFMSFQVIPINYGALLLILLGVILIIAELYVTSYGILSIGAAISIMIGSLLLVNKLDPRFLFEPGYGVDRSMIYLTTLVIVGFFALVGFLVVKSRVKKPVIGPEGLIGKTAEVTDKITPQHGGRVYVGGEYWFADSDEEIEKGASVEIIKVENLRLKVRKKVN